MVQGVSKWLRITLRRITTSIAFLPAIIALAFVLLSFLMIQVDFSPAGKALKGNMHWLSLRDASTARGIATVIAGGILSLTVFSFSMVMILLNQAASQLSNRVLYKLIGNRLQQVVLGIYIGTIIYALFLLTNIRDVQSGIYIPAISTYLLIGLTIIDIFLFIYFLHYVTQSVKFETIIHRIYGDTDKVLRKSCRLQEDSDGMSYEPDGTPIAAYKAGLFQGFDKKRLLHFCRQHNLRVAILHPVGTFLLENDPLVMVAGDGPLPDDLEEQLKLVLYIGDEQEIETHYYYGCKQLMEVAIKALSPGVNDPGTAVSSLQALAKLIAYRLRYFPERTIKDKEGMQRVLAYELTADELVRRCLFPIWDYGRQDRMVKDELRHMLHRLGSCRDIKAINELLLSVEQAVVDSV